MWSTQCKMKQEIKLIIIILIVIGAFSIGFYLNGELTGRAIENIQETYSYTKAVCGDFGCLDLFIQCSNGKMNVTPFTEYHNINLSLVNISNEVRC